MSGKTLMSLALDEKSFFDPNSVESSASLSGDSFIINGKKRMVIDACDSDYLIVVASLDESISLFLVDSKSKGIDIKNDVFMDAGSYSSISFNNVKVPAKNQLDIEIEGKAILKSILDIGAIGLSCEMLGSVQAAFNQTMDYIKEREQFGVKIGSFQALQHRSALMFGEIELCKSIVLKALQSIDSNDSNLSKNASLAKAKLVKKEQVTNEAMQMHGGIGVTDDVNIGFYFKRARVLQRLFGDYNLSFRVYSKTKRILISN